MSGLVGYSSEEDEPMQSEQTPVMLLKSHGDVVLLVGARDSRNVDTSALKVRRRALWSPDIGGKWLMP